VINEKPVKKDAETIKFNEIQIEGKRDSLQPVLKDESDTCVNNEESAKERENEQESPKKDNPISNLMMEDEEIELISLSDDLYASFGGQATKPENIRDSTDTGQPGLDESESPEESVDEQNPDESPPQIGFEQEQIKRSKLKSAKPKPGMRYSEMPLEPTEEGERRQSFSLDRVEKGKSNVLHARPNKKSEQSASQSKPRTTLARLAEERKSSVHEWMDLSDWPEKVKQEGTDVGTGRSPSGRTIIVAKTTDGRMYCKDPKTGMLKGVTIGNSKKEPFERAQNTHRHN